MPVTCGQIVERALRRLGVLAAGEAVSAGDLAVGLEALQEIMDGWRAGLFGRLRDVLATDDITAVSFDRIIGNNNSGITVTLPTATTDGEAIRDGAVVEVRDLFSTLSVNYRWNADAARWELLSGLMASSAMPLSDRFAGAVVAVLAVRLGDEFGAQPSPMVAADAGRGARAIARAGDSREDWIDW